MPGLQPALRRTNSLIVRMAGPRRRASGTGVLSGCHACAGRRRDGTTSLKQDAPSPDGHMSWQLFQVSQPGGSSLGLTCTLSATSLVRLQLDAFGEMGLPSNFLILR